MKVFDLGFRIQGLGFGFNLIEQPEREHALGVEGGAVGA